MWLRTNPRITATLGSENTVAAPFLSVQFSPMAASEAAASAARASRTLRSNCSSSSATVVKCTRWSEALAGEPGSSSDRSTVIRAQKGRVAMWEASSPRV
jgi:hypothetical protein